MVFVTGDIENNDNNNYSKNNDSIILNGGKEIN